MLSEARERGSAASGCAAGARGYPDLFSEFEAIAAAEEL